ncbi:hypothetical protein PMIN01_00389 [Paraphaeosphaeria minitans]|uniref:Uncharacterized protein n=1 Tax=Paraphaeosphaeria minitans TaxID=565426 RepID=A0A9P6GTI1_9PLEO|nr:hypothetical protein PMIN01_00389 [Paraphaeosphaeria minitans]
MAVPKAGSKYTPLPSDDFIRLPMDGSRYTCGDPAPSLTLRPPTYLPYLLSLAASGNQSSLQSNRTESRKLRYLSWSLAASVTCKSHTNNLVHSLATMRVIAGHLALAGRTKQHAAKPANVLRPVPIASLVANARKSAQQDPAVASMVAASVCQASAETISVLRMANANVLRSFPARPASCNANAPTTSGPGVIENTTLRLERPPRESDIQRDNGDEETCDFLRPTFPPPSTAHPASVVQRYCTPSAVSFFLNSTTHLDESDIRGLLPKCLPAHIEPVLADHPRVLLLAGDHTTERSLTPITHLLRSSSPVWSRGKRVPSQHVYACWSPSLKSITYIAYDLGCRPLEALRFELVDWFRKLVERRETGLRAGGVVSAIRCRTDREVSNARLFSIMVYYPVPKYIKKSALRNAADFTFSDDAKRANHDAAFATCMRCAQNLVKLNW